MWFEKVAKHAQQKRLYLLKANETSLVQSTICSDPVTDLNVHMHPFTRLVMLRTYIIPFDYSLCWIDTIHLLIFIWTSHFVSSIRTGFLRLLLRFLHGLPCVL
jgi:hypothetical protein